MKRIKEEDDVTNLRLAVDTYNFMELESKGYNKEQFLRGYLVELEHGTKGNWNLTDDAQIPTAKIVLAHLDENKEYYTILLKAGL
jgi:hypothetical protein